MCEGYKYMGTTKHAKLGHRARARLRFIFQTKQYFPGHSVSYTKTTFHNME